MCFFFYSVNIAKVACSSFRFIYSKECNHLGFLGGTVVKNPPECKVWVPSLGWGDPLEEEMATHSGILACKIPWTEEPGGL